MEYFNALTHVSKMLVDETSNELDSQKKFKRALLDTQQALKKSAGDFEDMMLMEDEMAMNFFAEEIFEIMNTLIKECARVMSSASKRKEELRKAVIWGNL